ncbi:hypothetical protein GCK72_018000 [Caenorhabditis remanei]|uniref:G-protein coupled receptors family 1 profile domain-containing protein n=1 Tax=Caenorhabditis remanei TaxID=31234 RepID=A0A6A5G9F4_CAERE|nr:hypothetical protein GCK72_018000 [Caenorhabditis remanei]KAF1751446.1 hypothetical protein GCK72_018000 [Caenorhabditis remanei]
MASEYNCTQFTEPFPEPGTDEASNSTVPWFITTVVKDRWQSPKYALRVACVLCSPVFIIATFVLFINAVKETEEDGIYLDISDLSVLNECLYIKLTLMASGFCFKILPCVSMLMFSVFLLRQIDKGKQSSTHNRSDKKEKIDRSSRFIQFVLVVFLVTESPQGVFSIIGGFAIIDYIK